MSGRDSVSSTPFISTSCLSFSSSWDHQTTCFGGGIQLLKKLNECNVTYTSYSLHTLHTLHTHFFIHTSDETWKCLRSRWTVLPQIHVHLFCLPLTCLLPAYIAFYPQNIGDGEKEKDFTSYLRESKCLLWCFQCRSPLSFNDYFSTDCPGSHSCSSVPKNGLWKRALIYKRRGGMIHMYMNLAG